MKKFNLIICALVSMFAFTGMTKALEVQDGDALKKCLADGEKCVLTADIDIMDDDYTKDAERVVIVKDATLDLNGKTLKAIFGVEQGATFTLDSSKEGGKLIANSRTTASASSIYAEASKLIFNGGTVTNDNGYGFYALEGGTIIVNGGTVVSRNSAVAGNNTTGVTYFEIYGGNLTAKEGPALYQPGPVSLKMTDGVLNGGIQLRMGIVDISGGTINALENGYDNVKEVYMNNKPLLLPDALSIVGGTYTAKQGTNDLKLTITGGTFEAKNEDGSAIAVYDFGKVEQKIETFIKNGTFKTASKTRGAYDVLTLKGLGVEKPNAGFGTYEGKVATEITGGKFSSDVTPYLAVKYTVNRVADGYVVEPYKESQTGDGSNTTAIIKTEEPFDNDLYLEVNRYDEEDEKLALKIINEKYKDDKKLPGLKLVGLYEINMVDGTAVVPMENGKFTISIAIDRSLRDYKNYKVLYFDEDGVIKEELKATLDNGYVTFTTTHLSDYAVIGYNDGNSNPETSDNVLLFACGLIVSTVAVTGIVLLKKQHN